jgi:hypothetical protein
VFWKQWHFPVKTRGRNVGEDEDDYYGAGGDGYDGYGGDPSLARAAEEEREFESSDRRPWTDLIPRFRVKVEPMTTLKVRGGVFVCLWCWWWWWLCVCVWGGG